ncbi:hypothetical protein [Gluconobacter cerinus]|uniref:Uncharacterized protein n=1 Tax=Gluconobacter cerinus TaxID=38307 RepID=A0A1B6VP68_9PROT|nr:hypothetical protein [Gluconobacter cerinus]OAJ69016.1 hypothetical protein A0123_00586 [Gluconobacter cerinus]
MKPLDTPKLVKIMAIANDPNSPAGERQAARARAEAMVTAAGYTASDTDALAQTAPRSSEASNPFSAFDDEMEKREPGYKAKRAAEQAERLRKRSEERARIIRTYGSEEAARAPTVLEKMVLQAVHPFIRVKKWREGRESGEYETLLGWTAHDFFKECPPRVQKAIEKAIPMPTNVAQAWEELSFWELREEELDHVVGGINPQFSPDWYLADACAHRRNIIRDLVEHKLRAQNITEIQIRLEYLHHTGCLHDEEPATALIADLEALRERLEALS